MAPRDIPLDDASGDRCTTTTSFSDHAIDDGSVLIQRTYYRLAAEATPTFDPTDDFFDSLESAFIWAYLGSNDERGVPDHVAAALDDALALTREEFADRPEADLRTAVLPAFYQHLAGFHCAYRAH
jgi:hypothetical protein